jgi:hypothetical protein
MTRTISAYLLFDLDVESGFFVVLFALRTVEIHLTQTLREIYARSMVLGYVVFFDR